MNKFEDKNLTAFKWFVLENFPFIEADFDALTECQLFCKLGKEINKIIDSQNVVGEQAETLTNAFNNLKNYVDNYFDNLDEEIGRVNTVINLLETDTSKIKEEQTRQNENISTNADEITNLKNENSYLQNVVKQAFTETSASGTELTINNTIEARMEMKLNGNTSQNGEPTPDTPIPVNVVTGDNSITISNNDNTQSQTYPINLGSMELCKIGDYQDYFYKSGSKWYLHKEIRKITLDGSETKWNKNNLTFYLSGNFPQTLNALCSHFTKQYNTSWISSDTIYRGKFTMGNIANQLKFMPIDENINTIEIWKTWLSTHNVTLYYALETPTDTEITDTTLISQLEALKTAMSYTEQTNISQINNGIPFNLDVIALTK